MRSPLTTRPAARHRLDRRRWPSILLLLAIVTAACSSSDESATDEVAPSTTTTEAQATSTTAPSADADADAASTSTTTTTTVPTERAVVAGEHWTSTTLLEDGRGIFDLHLVERDAELWLVGTRYNGSVAFRSDDAGVTWSDVQIETPPASGTSSVRGMTVGPDGRLLAWGAIGGDCGSGTPAPAGEGYLQHGFVCRSLRPALHISDDGKTFRRIEPALFQPPGDAQLVIAEIVGTDDGFVAVGTLRNEDWHARVWTSPDGENWTLARELRGPDGAMSAVGVIASPDGLIVLTEEHPCAVGTRNSGPGWFLGVNWAEHARLFSGPSAAELTLLTPDQHPLAPPPAAVDCVAQTGRDVAGFAYPSLRLHDVDGIPTVLEFTILEEPVDGGSETAARFTQRLDGAWTDAATLLLEEDDLSRTNARTGSSFDGFVPWVADDGELRFLAQRVLTEAYHETFIARTDDSPLRSNPLIVASLIEMAVLPDAMIAFGFIDDNPFDSMRGGDEGQELLLWRSVDGVIPTVSCEFGPGGSCSGVDLTLHPSYPDFTGLDLAGIDLAFANLGEGDFSGSDVSGARLWGIGDFGAVPDFTGANLAGSEIQRARLGSIDGADLTGSVMTRAHVVSGVGANFTDADLQSLQLEDATDAIFDGAFLRFADLEFTRFPEPTAFAPGQLLEVELALRFPEGQATAELSLAGWDLTDVEISGPSFDGSRRIVITDLTDTILTGARFGAVDFSPLPDDLALVDVDVWDSSICPDGEPPTDGPIGTCVRSG